MKDDRAKLDLLPHSEAKVQLYGTYLSIYLNILSRVPSVRRIYLFDLLCGEGKYANEGEGSPLIALQSIRNHYFSNNNSCPDIEIWFNDDGESRIEPGIAKIERVENFSKSYFKPDNVQRRFFKEDYNTILDRALGTIGQASNVKGLFFIDPYGYKDIRPSHIKKILANRNSEVLLFLPISFMYRFAESALSKPFPGSEPLATFMTELYAGSMIPSFRSAHDMIDNLKERFQDFLVEEGAFVDTFIIERDAANIYCLFFFTCNIRGLEKMLEAKWSLDKTRGQGYRTEQGIMLFTEAELQGYPNRLWDFLKTDPPKTNRQVYEFGLRYGLLPKHTKDFLDKWKKAGVLDVISLDGIQARSFYLPSRSHNRLVQFRTIGE